MDYSNGFLTVCILTFSTAVCILGLILGVVFIFFQRQREEQLLDDIHHTITQPFSFIMIKLSNSSGSISRMSSRNYQMPLEAYNSENISSNHTLSNIEGELQQDGSMPWGLIIFYILFSLFALLTILRWTDLQLSIFLAFIDSGRWRAYFGMEATRLHGQGNFKKVEIGGNAPSVKVVKKVRFYDDTTIVEDIERVETKSNGVDCADQDQTKRG
ncbi:hypothetical protein CEK26_013093 [Fusarium fujikuroi]|nr:hypothetical protein CEK27_013107 [Fusarium fujikuroi]QGI86502.1 hypothetical protein CEK25_013231 [Fusarium fujikuroi]QGJ00025.1 hypothetical protein CEK26_013093 [Fusarium fujikuroi]